MDNITIGEIVKALRSITAIVAYARDSRFRELFDKKITQIGGE